MKNKFLEIFLVMLKIGAFTFGGGYAMIALLENEFVSKKKWIDKEEFLNMVAIAESTPGPVAINSATYLGYKVAGVVGSVIATLGVTLPSFIIIYIISLFFDAFLSLELVGYAFRGIQVCVIYLIFTAGLKFVKELPKTPFNITLAVTVLFVMILSSVFAVGLSSIVVILASGAVGISAYVITTFLRRGEKNDIS